MLDTAQSLRDGSWVIYPSGVASTLLRYPVRNHEVLPRSMGSGSEDTYILPIAYQQTGGDYEHTAGMRIPIGTKMWVHNRSAVSGIANIETADAGQSFLLDPNCSCAFVLTAASGTNVGTWRRVGANLPNAKGPDVPDGFWFDLDLRRSQNNVNVLEEAVAAGYDGTEPAIVRVKVWPSFVIGSSHPLIKALDMGGDTAVGGINWDSGSIFILTIDQAVISGCPGAGGGGGIGGTGASAGVVGGNGGTAIRAPNDLVIYSTGVIQGGGGGGGGGNATAGTAGLNGGAGGGGGGANVAIGGYVNGGAGGTAGTGASAAGNGTLWLGGSAGVGSIVAGNQGGTGGQGGQPGSNGGTGAGYNNVGAGAVGGTAGYAISRATGATITFGTGAGGIVTGSTVVE